MIEFVKILALEAGKLAMSLRENLKAEDISSKSTVRDMVTVADRKVEEFIISKINKKHPEHGVFGEETGKSQTDAEYVWIIDPIDGTTSYIHDLQYYSVSIALQHNGQTIAAVVCAPRLDELFWADSTGAWLNDKRIHASGSSQLQDCLLATGFACVRSNLKANNLEYFARVLPAIRGIRRCGSAAIDLCYVACGRFDGFWELNLAPYDIAAGAYILQQAGGQVTDMHGGESFPQGGTLATNKIIHKILLKQIHGN
ncbi:MAG: inositol monophosphatase [Lentisphaerae bacterium]|nr:inositol monophosphatase [Lentisphaerota bacterium]MCP4101122.1 inositol monophosphatase [Lentisphaerota bacterium]